MPRTAERADAESGAVHDRGSGDLHLAMRDGLPVLVRRIEVDGDAGHRAHALLLARRLVGVEHANLLPVLAAEGDWAGLDLVCEVPDAVTSVATLVAARRLAAGEVVRLGAAVADALAALHAAGLTHGRLGAADLLVRADGSVVVVGYGVAGVLGSAGDPADDVADLLQLLAVCLDDSDANAPSVRRVLHELAADPGLDAEQLVVALRALPVEAEAVRLSGRRVPPSVHRPPRRRQLRLPHPRMGWRMLGAVLPAAVGVLLLAGWLGASLPDAAGETPAVRPGPTESAPATPSAPALSAPTPSRPRPTPPAASPRAAPAPPDWAAVVKDLDEARSRLFAEPDEHRVATVDVRGSSAYAADLALVRNLVAHHGTSSGFRTEVLSVRVLSVGATHADLVVVDVLHPYRIVSGGQVLQQRLGRPARTTIVTLVRADGAWRVAEVRPG